MAFPEQFLDEIRARVPLSEVIGRRVPLKRKGRGEFAGLCPFHEEKTPSFTVSDDKGFYHCFGCQAHGSVFDFVMHTRGLAFPEAVERLAAEAGMEMPAPDPHYAERKQEQDQRIAALEAAAAWFEGQLAGKQGAEARTYVAARGVETDTAEHFRLGYAPDARAALLPHLQALGHPAKLLAETGLVKIPEDGGGPYDYFRHRLMFPILDRRGRVVGFGGRALGESRAKYLNSPEGLLFHKGALLYNHAEARAAARQEGTVVVAEGYTDVIALWQAGFGHTVAPLGTALTETQLGELWRMAPEPVICMDGDAAGWAAAERIAERALALLRPGHSLRFSILPRGEDPDSLVRAGGAEAMARVLNGALPLVEVLWRSLAQGDFTTPERRAGLRQAAFERAGRIGDPTVRAYYRQHFAARLEREFGARPAPARGRGERIAGRGTPPWPRERRLAPDGGALEHRFERVLLAALVHHPEAVAGLRGELADVRLEDPELDRLYREILEIAGGGGSLDTIGLRRQLTERGAVGALGRVDGWAGRVPESIVRAETPAEDVEAGVRDLLASQREAAGERQRRAAVKAAKSRLERRTEKKEENEEWQADAEPPAAR